MSYSLDNAQTDLLLPVRVDRARVGDSWPIALVQIIEAHERHYVAMVTRKTTHVLIDRYAAALFPDVTVEYEHRRAVIKLLRERQSYRVRRYLERLASVLPSAPVVRLRSTEHCPDFAE